MSAPGSALPSVRVVPGVDFDRDPEIGQALQRFAGVGLRGVEKDQESHELKAALVVGRRRMGIRRRPGGHGDDPVARRELSLKGSSGLGRHVAAAFEHGLGRPLGDESLAAVPIAYEDRDHEPVVIEGKDPEPGEVGPRGARTDAGR